MIFDIPELDKMVCSRLDLGNLVKCAVVNKQWNRIATPYVWHTIPRTRSQNQWRKLHRLILEGYFQQKYREKQGELQVLGKLPRKQRTTRYVRDTWKNLDEEMTITKYGRFIQEVEDWHELWTRLASVGTKYVGRIEFSVFELPSDLEIFQHFLQQCPHILRSFQFQYKFCRLIGPPEKSQPEDVLRFLMNIVPSVRNLSIGDMTHYFNREPCPLLLLKHIIAAADINNLDSLSIIIKGEPDSANTDPEFATLEGNPNPEILARPRHLALFQLDSESGPITNWSWLWEICGRLISLEASHLAGHIIEDLSLGIREFMPRLETLRLRGPYVPGRSTKSRNTAIAALIRANTRGWRAVTIDLGGDTNSQIVSALLESSYSTLQELIVVNSFQSRDVVRILKSCPQLRKLHIQKESYRRLGSTTVNIKDFLDLDPNTGAFLPWPCMNSLEYLDIRFPGTEPWLDQENQDCFAQTHRIRLKLLERIGMFTNLRILKMKFSPKDDDLRSYSVMSKYWSAWSTSDNPTRLTLSIDTGLTTLVGLKKLEELAIWNMNNSISVIEAQWIAQHWPRLSKISGLSRHSPAFAWFREHRPYILCTGWRFVF